MYKQQFYDIHASFLVPVYNMPNGVYSDFIATQRGEHSRGKILIDVWLVRALRENPTKSMIESLLKEEQMYQMELDKALKENATSEKKDEKILSLEHGKKVFSDLVKMSQNTVYHKKPDNEFLQIAQRNLSRDTFRSCQPDLEHYLYLAGLSSYDER